MARAKTLKWFSGACAVLCLKGCALSFEDYPEADLCAAAKDAGIDPVTAPDPALRGCDAGPATAVNTDLNPPTAGASGMDGTP